MDINMQMRQTYIIAALAICIAMILAAYATITNTENKTISMTIDTRYDTPGAKFTVTPGKECNITIHSAIESKKIHIVSTENTEFWVPIRVPSGVTNVTAEYNCGPAPNISPKSECNTGDRDYDKFCSAILSNSKKYCDLITRDEMRYLCYATIYRDGNWCDGIPQQYWRDWCLLDCIKNKYCTMRCDAIDTPELRAACEGNCSVRDELARRYCTDVSRD